MTTNIYSWLFGIFMGSAIETMFFINAITAIGERTEFWHGGLAKIGGEKVSRLLDDGAPEAPLVANHLLIFLQQFLYNYEGCINFTKFWFTFYVDKPRTIMKNHG